ncbi:MAG: glutaminase A [Planctomycetota bacterium]
MTVSNGKSPGRKARARSRSNASGAGRIGARATRERLLFDALRGGRGSTIRARDLRLALERVGLTDDDPRLRESLAALRRRTRSEADAELDLDAFGEVVRPGIPIIERALQGLLVLPEFESFGAEVERIFERVRDVRGGAVADYIPQLGRVDPERYGVALVSTDGQRLGLGDSTTPFCVQSTCKPVSYCLALEEHGSDHVHRYIGCEPSGHSFNELTLNREGRPHNPMINAGAIMSGSLIQPGLTPADRFDHVLGMWRDLAGGARPSFSNATYLSERGTSDRNFALGYFMRENGAFPDGTDLVSALEFFFQCCSIEMSAESMAMVAATLANGGVCPTTGVQVLRPDTVQKCLSLMVSCGMYDFSGEWAFSIGLPAKSGVSGAILVVVPGVLGLCVWSPRLDPQGNSVRGIEFCRQLVSTFHFHGYDHHGAAGKVDPRRRASEALRDLGGDLCWAASEGDLDALRRLAARGAALDSADYDGRTPAHLAASEGQRVILEFLADLGVSLERTDRWGNTPLDDARRGGHDAVAELLQTWTNRPAESAPGEATGGEAAVA